MKRIGIYGGSFDPVHNGHLHLASVMQKRLHLDEVIFVPTHISPFKQGKVGVTEDVHRLAMLRLALESEPGMHPDDFEMRQEGVSYTVYTLRHFKECFPDAQLVLLMGSDMLLNFERWYCWKEILAMAELGCVARTQADAEKLHEKAAQLESFGRVFVFCEDILPLSSTEIRSFFKKGEDCSCYLPQKVVQYIVTHHLYGTEGDSEMYDVERMAAFLKKRLSSERYTHVMNVAKECRKLAKRYGEDPERAYFAGMVHDICKEDPKEQQHDWALLSGLGLSAEEESSYKVWHGAAGAYFLQEMFGVRDMDILYAVRFHTVGRSGMSMLEKIVYLGDMISDERSYSGVEVMRKTSYEDLNLAMLHALHYSLRKQLKRNALIPHYTLEAYNEYARMFPDNTYHI